MSNGCNEFFFMVGSTKPTRSNALRISRVAKENGAAFVEANLPDGYKHWFSTNNLGEPFNSNTANRVRTELAQAGLLDNNGLVKSCKTR